MNRRKSRDVTQKNVQRRRRKRERNRGYGTVYLYISILIVSAAILFGITFFFKIEAIEVTGNERYTSSEIIEALSVHEGDNLFLLNTAKHSSRAKEALPYLKNIEYKRRLPGHLKIIVEERKAFFAFHSQNTVWLSDREYNLLEYASIIDSKDLVQIYGITLYNPYPGLWIYGDNPPPSKEPAEEKAKRLENMQRLRLLKTLLDKFEEYNIMGQVSKVDMSVIHNVTARYLDRFELRFGVFEDLDAKARFLANINEAIPEDKTGILDLTADTPRFIEDKT